MANLKFTILGGSGFIGRHLVVFLNSKGHQTFVPDRRLDCLRDQDLGHVIYAIGLTGDFRDRPYDTIDAHVNVLTRLLGSTRFSSWLYLSSTRVYGVLPGDGKAAEEDALRVIPSKDSIYDLSKLLGEAICLSHQSPNVRVARLSNVYGPGQSKNTFLGALLKELHEQDELLIRESPRSSKDYISVHDAVRLLELIAISGKARIYNVASGTCVSHSELSTRLAQLTGKKVRFSRENLVRTYPQIDITKVVTEFGFRASSFLDALPTLIS